MSHNDDTNTVQQVTFRLLRELNMTKVFGNPGSTELNFLNNFPEDFEYILALQESSVVAMADGMLRRLAMPLLLICTQQ